jgi:xylulokinase
MPTPVRALSRRHIGRVGERQNEPADKGSAPVPPEARSGVRPRVYLGLDVGTSNVKALAVTGAGQVLGTASVAHPLRQPRPGWAEQHPDDWWAAACAALRQVCAEPAVAGAPVAALGLSGQMHGATLLDGAGHPLRPSLIWADERGLPWPADFLAHVTAALPVPLYPADVPPADVVPLVTGSQPYASATLAKLLWVREEQPEVWAKVSHVLLAKDEVRRRLTGALATDLSDASGTQLYALRESWLHGRRWSALMLDALGPDAGVLPAIQPADAIAGEVTLAAARPMGLPPGTPVATGGGDVACAAFGVRLGEAGAGDVFVSLGTAGQVLALLDGLVIDLSERRIQTFHYVTPDRCFALGAILSAGHSLAWLAAVAGTQLAALQAEASAVAPGAGGVLCLPSLLGERTGSARPHAAFLGLTAAHTRAHLARAVVEGVAFALRERLEAVRALGVAAERVLLAGAPAGADLWPRVLADVLALPVARAPGAHGSALGAARLAARTVGEDLAPVVATTHVTVPTPERVAVYARLYPLYAESAAALGA